MSSPGHRAAILRPDVTHIGIGVAQKKEFDQTTYLVTELFIRRITPLGPDAKTVFRRELDRLREAGGASALEEDPALSRFADEAAREFLENEALSQKNVLERLQGRLARIRSERPVGRHRPLRRRISRGGSRTGRLRSPEEWRPARRDRDRPGHARRPGAERDRGRSDLRRLSSRPCARKSRGRFLD